MGSEQDKAPTTSIVDMPLDILLLVFSFIVPSCAKGKGKVDFEALSSFFDSDGYRTIKNARLACWALNVTASQILCPILQVSLEEQSLKRVRKICSNKMIYSGIRGVRIFLPYRPSEITRSLERYRHCKLRQLEKIYDKREPYEHEKRGLSRPRSPRGRERSDALHLSTLRHAWNAMSNKQHILSEDDIYYQSILTECYEKYRKDHDEQVRLISQGTFVSEVASLLSRLEHPISLSLLSYSDHTPRSGSDTSGMPLASRSNLRRFMNMPHDWDTIDKLTHEPSRLSMSKLLVDIPIACSKAGAVLQHIHIDCFPLSSHFMTDNAKENLNWEALGAASQMLKTLHFGPSLWSESQISRHFRPTLDQNFINQLLGSLISGPKLEDCSLNMHSFGLRCGGWGKQGVATFNYNIDAALFKIRTNKIKSFKLGYVSLQEKSLESLCESFDDELEAIELNTVRFTKSNNWADVLDRLSVKVATGMSAEKCQISFFDLS